MVAKKDSGDRARSWASGVEMALDQWLERQSNAL